MNGTTRPLIVSADADKAGLAIQYGTRLLAREPNAGMTIVDVNEFLEHYVEVLQDIIDRRELRGLVLRQRLDQLYRLVGQHVKPSLRPPRIKLLEGVPFIEIIREAQRGKHDLIIKTASSESDRQGQLFGSVDLHLMRKSPVPVLILDPARPRLPTRALVLVDVSSSRLQAFNERIVDHAVLAAERLGCEIELLTVWNVAGEKTMRSNPMLKIDERRIQRIGDKLQLKAKERLAKLAKHIRVSTELRINPSIKVVKGIPETVIPAIAKDRDAELIVMGTVGHADIPGMFIGNTAESVLGQVQCPVLAVKPADFVTPVTVPSPLSTGHGESSVHPFPRIAG